MPRPYRGWSFRHRAITATVFAVLLIAYAYEFARIGFLPWYIMGFLVSGAVFVPVLIFDVEIGHGVALHNLPEFALLFFTGYIAGAISNIIPSLFPLLFTVFVPATFLLFLVIMLVAHRYKLPQSKTQTLRDTLEFLLFVVVGMLLGLVFH